MLSRLAVLHLHVGSHAVFTARNSNTWMLGYNVVHENLATAQSAPSIRFEMHYIRRVPYIATQHATGRICVFPLFFCPRMAALHRRRQSLA